MKTIVLLILTAVMLGCAPTSNTNVEASTNVNISQKASISISDFQKGMEDGAIISTVVLGKTICDSFNAPASRCQRLEYKMAQVAILSIQALPPSVIQGLYNRDSSYRAAVKNGAVAFSIEVGDVLCKTANTTSEKCQEIKAAMTEASHEFIDKLSDEQLHKIKNSQESSKGISV